MPSPESADRVEARSNGEAWKRYRRFLQQPLSAIDPSAQWVRITRPDGVHVMATRPARLTLSRSRREAIYLEATQLFTFGDSQEFPGERKVVTLAYAYTLSELEDLSRELFSWQWQPEGWPHPHLHIGRAHPEWGDVAKWHVPTGRVAFEEVVRFLIDDHGVQGAPTTEEALRTIDETLTRFRNHRSWH